jgi:hypothetical protein
MTIALTEIDAMLAGAAEFLSTAPSDALTAEITALAAPGQDELPAARPRVRYWKTTDDHTMLARNDSAGHVG